MVASLRIIFVPLQSPCLGERFLRSMRTILFSMKMWCGASPAGVSFFRNSSGSLVESLWSLVLSALDGIVASPGNSSCEMMALIWSSELFFGVSITFSAIQRSPVALEHGSLHWCREISSQQSAIRVSLMAMPESSCISLRFSGGTWILSGSSAIGRSPFPNLRRHLSMCCRDWSWPILMFSLSSKIVKNLQRGRTFIDAAVMWNRLGWLAESVCSLLPESDTFPKLVVAILWCPLESCKRLQDGICESLELMTTVVILISLSNVSVGLT